jgi:hypothetical protein
VTRLEGFDEDGFQLGHFICAEDVIAVKVAFDGIAFLVVAHFFADGVSEGLRHAALNLPRSGERIDDHARVNSHHEPVYSDLTRFRIHGHFGELSRKRRRRYRRDVTCHAHDLFLMILVKRISAISASKQNVHLAQWL